MVSGYYIGFTEMKFEEFGLVAIAPGVIGEILSSWIVLLSDICEHSIVSI